MQGFLHNKKIQNYNDLDEREDFSGDLVLEARQGVCCGGRTLRSDHQDGCILMRKHVIISDFF